MRTAARRQAKARKRHVQRELRFDKNGQRRGGFQSRKGRPAKNPNRPSERHKRRPEVDPRKPLHVTLRVADAVGYLRKPRLFAAIRIALFVVSKREDFRIVHFSIQGNHLHLIVEAASREALWKGMKGFAISAAKRINGELRKRREREDGVVFPDRYHVREITSVAQMRNCLSYVLNNWRHHRARGDKLVGLFGNRLDEYSSAALFLGWKERLHGEPALPDRWEAPAVSAPRTWLLAHGWRRARPISVWEIPKGAA
jgi:REP element-mobilizing transposase RayT